MKYMQKPSVMCWKHYYEYKNSNKTYSQIAEKYGVTGARIRSFVMKVVKYLENGNTRIYTEKEVEEILNKPLDIKDFWCYDEFVKGSK